MTTTKNQTSTLSEREKILAEYAKLATVGHAIDALIIAATSNNMGLEDMATLVLSMANRKTARLI